MNSSLVAHPSRAIRRLLVISTLAASAAVAAPRDATACDFEQTILHDVMPAATFVNVYWSSNWDATAPPGMTRQAIDAYTQALVDSTYFDAARADYGIGTPTFGGSIQDVSVVAPRGPVDIPYMSNEVNAALRDPRLAGIRNVVVNLFVPIGTTPRNLKNSDCPGNFSTFHTKSNYTSTPFTVIPMDPTCFAGSFPTETAMFSHELIETMTDPGGEGYVHDFDYTEGEVADACQAGGPFPTPAPEFLLAMVAPYFSDGSCSCVPSFPSSGPMFNPLSLSPGGGTVAIRIDGSGFGTLPAHFTLPTTANTPYLELVVTRADGTTVNAGDSIDAGGDPQLVRIEQWAPSYVSASVPSAFLMSCDAVTLQVWNPTGTSTATASTTFAEPAIVSTSIPSMVALGEPQTLEGFVLDVRGVAVAGVSVEFAGRSAGGSPVRLSPSTAVTDAEGRFATTFTPSVDGEITLTASTLDCSGTSVTTTLHATVGATTVQCGFSPGAGRAGFGMGVGLTALALLAAARRRRNRPALR